MNKRSCELQATSGEQELASYQLQAASEEKQGTRNTFFGKPYCPPFAAYCLQLAADSSRLAARSPQLIVCSLLLAACFLLSSCGIYTFKDVSIPPEVKTVKISYIENKARIVNPQLSPRLTDALQQKISNQTKLTRTTSDDAHYQISGAITNYFVSTVGVSGKQTNQNQLTVGVHIVFKNTLQNKTDEFDVSRDFPFGANQTLDQAINTLLPDILKNITDEIFNHIFSNW